ncbi:MAG: MFS transporter, partial [Propioniciclava sp.]
MGRVIQGLAGGAVPALATVSIAKSLPPGRRGGALGLITSSVGVGSAIGPVVGGIVQQVAGWHSLFFGTMAIAVLLIPGALRVLPDGGATGDRRFDLGGGLLLGLAAGLFLFGITQGQSQGFGAPASWGSFLAAVLAAASFVWRINTAANPFAPPARVGNVPVVAAQLVTIFAMFTNKSTFIMVPQLLTEVNGLAPAAAGL